MHHLLIVEDDPFISRSIVTTFKDKPFQIIGVAKSVIKARELLELHKPDVCLVDIQLKGEELGTSLASDLDLLQIPYLYLTAQTDPNTLEVVSKTNPLGYIVKPFTQASLWSSFSVSWQQYLNKQKTIFTVKVDGYLYKIDEADILYLEAFDNYCYLYTTNKKLLIPRTLKSVKESLQASYYFTPHRSYLINLKRVTNMGKRTVEIEGEEIPLSEARRPELLKILK